MRLYEEHYQLNVRRGFEVSKIRKDENVFTIHSRNGDFNTKTVISATGTWGNPLIPNLEGRKNFQGVQIHSQICKKLEDLLE